MINNGTGFFQHGHTYMGHSTACAASLAVLRRLIDDDLIEQCKSQGELLNDALQDIFSTHPNIGDIRGRGLFFGLELVASKETKKPFLAEQKIHQRIKTAAFSNGLICYPNGGTIDGKQGDHILLAPPFIINDSEIDELVDKLSRSIKAVL